MRLPSLICVLAFSMSASAQMCADAACFGPTGADPLVIAGTWTVAADANLDFGPRHVILTGTLVLNGPASISAAKITSQPGSLIDGRPVAMSHLSIATTPAGIHDASATLNGNVDLSGWPPGLTWGQAAGNFTLNAGGPATIQWLDTTGGTSDVAGNVTITAPSITIGTIHADVNDYYSVAAIVTLTSTGPVTVDSIFAQTSDHSSSSEVHITAASYVQTSMIIAAPYQPGGFGAPPCTVTVNVSGAAALNGTIQTGWAEEGGTISVIAGGAITWTNAVAMANGRHGGWVELRSLGADVTVAGSIFARSEFFSDYGAANVQLEAAGQLDFTGTLDIGTDQPDPQPNRQARLIAGQTLTIHSGSLIEGRDAASVCTHFGPSILLEGCRIVVESSVAVFTCGAWGTAIDVHVRDTFTSDGTLASGPAPGGIFVTSRLPWAYALQGTGSMTPAPQVTVNPDLLPCLGAGTQIIAPSSLTPGQTLSVTVSSVPNKPILAVANTAIAHLSLDAFGWTQVNPFTAFVLADHAGLLGPVVPGATGATGIWTWTINTPATPVLSNVDAYLDVYVLDPGAPNGVFRQPPFAHTHFN